MPLKEHQHTKTGKLRVAALTDVGLVRDRNEDSMAVLPDEGLLVVSDGLGGHRAGDVASGLVVGLLPALLASALSSVRREDPEQIGSVIRDCVTRLSRDVCWRGKECHGQRGMGATLVMALFRDGKLHVAAMGDSRAYLYRRGQLSRLTSDHSIVGILLSQGDITPELAKTHEARGRLTRYMGMEAETYPDVKTISLQTGDRIVLCSDGLTDDLDDQAMADLLHAGKEPDDICHSLVHAAKQAGGKDNITAIVAEWREEN